MALLPSVSNINCSQLVLITFLSRTHSRSHSSLDNVIQWNGQFCLFVCYFLCLFVLSNPFMVRWIITDCQTVLSPNNTARYERKKSLAKTRHINFIFLTFYLNKSNAIASQPNGGQKLKIDSFLHFFGNFCVCVCAKNWKTKEYIFLFQRSKERWSEKK